MEGAGGQDVVITGLLFFFFGAFDLAVGRKGSELLRPDLEAV